MPSGYVPRLLMLWPSWLRGFLPVVSNHTVLHSKPLSNFLRVKTHCSSHTETRECPPRRHAINVFVVHAEKLAEFRDLHGAAARF